MTQSRPRISLHIRLSRPYRRGVGWRVVRLARSSWDDTLAFQTGVESHPVPAAATLPSIRRPSRDANGRIPPCRRPRHRPRPFLQL